MKKLIVIFLAIVFLTGISCVTAQSQLKTAKQPEPGNTTSAENLAKVKPENQLTAPEVAVILRAAITDIEKQGCQPEFLSEGGAYIWVRCFDEKENPVMKLYHLQNLIDGYVKQKNRPKNEPSKEEEVKK